MGGDGVQEVTVVADHEHRVLEVGQVILQPGHGVEVQVIGGLVQQQVVGVAEQGLCQQYAHLLVGRDILHEHLVAVFAYAQAGEQGCGVALGVPTLEFGELLLEFGGAYAVLIAEVLLGVDGVLFGHDVPQDGVAAQHGLQHGALVELEVVLFQHREALAGAHGDGARGGGELAGEDTHQGGFTGTVGTDDAVAVATVEGQVHVLEQDTLAELYGKVICLNHLLLST